MQSSDVSQIWRGDPSYDQSDNPDRCCDQWGIGNHDPAEHHAKFRITYSIERRQPGDADFTEIGFGSTSANNTVDGALYAVQSDVQNRQWETREGMPEPEDV
jgi:hypothetical protein